MIGNIIQDGVQRSDLKRIVARDSFMMQSILFRFNTDMASGLTSYSITQWLENLNEFCTS